MKRKLSPVVEPIPVIIKLRDDQEAYDIEFQHMISYISKRDPQRFKHLMTKLKLKTKHIKTFDYNANSFREILQTYIKMRANSYEMRSRQIHIVYPLGGFNQC